MRLPLIVFTLLILSIPAFAADQYRCSADANGSVDRALFSDMILTVDGGNVSGKILTDSGWMNIGTRSANFSMDASVKASRVSLSYGQYYDTATLDFDLVDGETTGDYYQSVDCVGENSAKVSVTCTKTQ